MRAVLVELGFSIGNSITKFGVADAFQCRLRHGPALVYVTDAGEAGHAVTLLSFLPLSVSDPISNDWNIEHAGLVTAAFDVDHMPRLTKTFTTQGGVTTAYLRFQVILFDTLLGKLLKGLGGIAPE